MQAILTVNGGSSSLKCALFERSSGAISLIYSFKLGNILNTASFRIFDANGNKLCDKQPDFSHIPSDQRHQACLEAVFSWINQQPDSPKLTAIGHRVVHGGEDFSAPHILDDELLEQLAAFIPLAPLHQPYNLKLVSACKALAPDLPQIACFDTMFHANQPRLEKQYAIPRKYTEEGIKRYGFHGLSYEYIQRQLNALDSGSLNTVVCHLGAGASMCAIKQGQSVSSSMGFTAVDGLPMGSRCGNIDPGVLLYLQRHHHMSTDDLEAFIYKESGWLGVSGVSSDMLELHQSEHPAADEAIELFCYRAALEIGRLTAALEGLQQIVFTGGVGENDADVRSRILQRCQWLGAEFDPEANIQGQPVIHSERSQVAIRIIPTNEEAMIATHVMELIS